MQINELYFGYTPYTKYVNEEEISLPKFKEAISKPENNLIKDITDFLSKYDEKYNKEQSEDGEIFNGEPIDPEIVRQIQQTIQAEETAAQTDAEVSKEIEDGFVGI